MPQTPNRTYFSPPNAGVSQSYDIEFDDAIADTRFWKARSEGTQLNGTAINVYNNNDTTYGKLPVVENKIAALYIIFDGIRGVLTASLRGLQDSKIPMRVGIFCLWLIGIPCAYIAGFVLNGGPIALRFGFVAGVASAMVIMLIRYKKLYCLWN